jgi:SAM-dependent methyltransferase
MDSLPDVTWENVPCPLCGCRQSTARFFGSDLLYAMPGEFQLVRCTDCGHHFLNPRPTPECIHRFYPEDYGPHHPPPLPDALAAPSSEAKPSKRPWYLSQPVRWIPGLRRLYYGLSETHAHFIPAVDGPRKRALDLGCADGVFLEKLRAAGWDARGVELVPDAARRAQQRGFEVQIGRFEPAMFSAGSFDAVFAWMVIEHLHDPLGALVEARRLLADSGWLVFSVPNFACWERRLFGRYWYPLALPVHLHQFTPRTVRQLLARAGFDQVRVIHQRSLLNLVGSIGLRWRAWVPGSRLAEKLVRYPDHPGLWSQLAMAPSAILLAWLRQGGRLTIVARAVTGPGQPASACRRPAT